MTKNEIALMRLVSHHLSDTGLADAESAVQWMGGMQAQDYEQAKWAVGSRLSQPGVEKIEKSIAARSVVRTWLLRGTLHFVHRDDVHWMLQLAAPLLAARLRTRHAELNLKERQFEGFYSLLRESLKRGKELTRTQLSEVFRENGIDVQGQRLYHILVNAALDQVVCCGTKNDSFRLLPASRKKADKDESVTKLAKIYFTSHGPATVDDFANWAGLTLKDARNGTEVAAPKLESFVFEKKTYWHAEISTTASPSCLMLAGFDEYYLGYKDKSISADTKHAQHIMQKNGIFNPVILIDGHVQGVWKRTFNKDMVTIEINAFKTLSKAQKELVTEAAGQFSRFAGRKLNIIF